MRSCLPIVRIRPAVQYRETYLLDVSRESLLRFEQRADASAPACYIATVLEHRNPVEVPAILRTAQSLLVDEAEQLRRQAAVQPDAGDWTPTPRYRALLDGAADLDTLAREIAAVAEQAKYRFKHGLMCAGGNESTASPRGSLAYWIISVACCSTESGIVRPMARAVFRLTTRSNSSGP
jgi:hypothetical protein